MHHGMWMTVVVTLATVTPAQAAEPTGTRTVAPKEAALGQPAPAFTLTDVKGNAVSLTSFKGKTVVLEWFNPECPFVVFAHGKGPLRDMPAKYTKQGVVWLAINSGAPGKQGTGKDKNLQKANEWGMSYPVLLDEEGKVGRAYGARTTPHMYIIDPRGVLVYRGALDNAPLGEPEGGKTVSYAEQALMDVLAGRTPTNPDTKPYGCSVKYGG